MAEAPLTFSLVFLVFGVIWMPGVLLYYALFDEEDPLQAVIQGLVFGFAASVVIMYYCIHVHAAGFYWCWAVFAIASIVVAYRRSRWPWTQKSWDKRTALIVTGIAAAVLISRLLPALRQTLPPGSDPSSHMLLAQKAMQLNKIFTDWQPFDPAITNYPLGMHFYLAMLSKVTASPLHQIYNILIPIFGALTTLQVYGLGVRVTGRKEAGYLGAFTYGFLALYGSIGYYTWGGLPNLMGMCVLVFSIDLLLRFRLAPSYVIAFGLSFFAIFALHHHVMVTAGCVWLALFVYYLTAGKQRDRPLGMALAGLFCLVVGGIHIVPYILRIAQIGETGVLRFREPLFTIPLILQSLGYVFTAVALLGIFVACMQFRTFEASARKRWVSLAVVTGTLVLLFAVLSYGYRFYMLKKHGVGFVAFTPSRFLSNSTVFLSIFGGLFGDWVMRNRRSARHLGVGIAALILLAAVGNYNFWKDLYTMETFDPVRYEAYEFIRAETPAEAVVLDSNQWAPYLTGRRSMYTPMGISETPKGIPVYRQEIQTLLADPSTAGESDYYLVIVGSPEELRFKTETLWKHPSGLSVLRILIP